MGGDLRWPACQNVRDLGGLPTVDGRWVRERALVRADALSRLTADGAKAALDHGVGAVVDLCSPGELAGGHPFDAHPGYRAVPFVDAERDRERDKASERDRADLYRGSLDRNGRQVAAAVRAVAAAPPGAVVVHCLSGADRTGMLVALLLDALGVRRDLIANDYRRTFELLDGPAPEPYTMQETLAHLDERWAGSRGYLHAHRITDAELAALDRRLVGA